MGRVKADKPKRPGTKYLPCLGWCNRHIWTTAGHRRCSRCESRFQAMRPARTCYEVPMAAKEDRR